MRERPVPEELRAELGALLRAGNEREVIARLHREAGLNFHKARVWIAGFWREALYRPPLPCPYCGELLRTALARQCFLCGKDWHDTADP